MVNIPAASWHGHKLEQCEDKHVESLQNLVALVATVVNINGTLELNSHTLCYAYRPQILTMNRRDLMVVEYEPQHMLPANLQRDTQLLSLIH